MWRSWLARTAGGREVAGSSPVTPTMRYTVYMNDGTTLTVFVSAIVQNDGGETLVLQRSVSDEYLPGYYELPGGRVHVQETLESALSHKLETEVGLRSCESQFVRSLANVEAKGPYVRVYFTILLNGSIDVKLSAKHDGYKWVTHSSVADMQVTADTKAALSLQSDNNDDKKTTYCVHSDGGSRGNPGPSAAAFIITRNGSHVLSGGEYIGITTNNQAEYVAVLLALEALRNIADADDTVLCNIDSLLVVNQLNGAYKIKNRDLWPVHQKILELSDKFGTVTFRHVPREQNVEADARVNTILDEHNR